jgi:hypothetical protein
MRQWLIVLAGLLGAAALAVPVALAGSPHQVGACSTTQSGNTLSVTCKEAGLGDESQIEVSASATALCINGGGNHPKAVNKETLSTKQSEPVQNGQTTYTITFTASFSPSCDPPMTVQFTDVSLTDTTNNISLKL